MNIIINISESTYRNIKYGKSRLTERDANNIISAIKNGTPLPKGHGRLLDEKLIIENAVKGLNGIYDLTDMPDYIAGLPAIIPAESEAEVTETSMHHLACAMCDNEKCVRGTKECEFEQWKKKEDIKNA